MSRETMRCIYVNNFVIKFKMSFIILISHYQSYIIEIDSIEIRLITTKTTNLSVSK